jgi:hypothetical protein
MDRHSEAYSENKLFIASTQDPTLRRGLFFRKRSWQIKTLQVKPEAVCRVF